MAILRVGILCAAFLCASLPPAPLAMAQDDAEPEQVEVTEASSAEPVPLYEPLDPVADAAGADGGTVPLYDPSLPAPSVEGAEPSGGFEPRTVDGSGSEGGLVDGGTVPLFEPDSGRGGGAGDGGLVPLFDPISGGADAGRHEVPLYDPRYDGSAAGTGGPESELGGDLGADDGWRDEDWDQPTTRRESFDLEAARQLLATEMSTPSGETPLEAELDIVAPDALDSELETSELRGANELGLDLRSVERFRWQCTNELGRRDVTLFGNGTVRLRTGPVGAQELQLDELTQEELLDYLARLSRIHRARELHHDMAGAENFGQIDGELGASCQLVLRLPDLATVALTMPRLEVPQLGVAQLIEIADELAAFTRPIDRPRQVRADYVPRNGDQLRRKDGLHFRVIGPTSDGGGVELEGLQEPIRIYYRLVDLPLLFEPVEGELDVAPVDPAEPEVREIVDRLPGS